MVRGMASKKGMQDAELPFCIALLHDIGTVVFAVWKENAFSNLVSRAENEQRPLDAIERETYGFDHAEVGAELCDVWNLPKVYGNTIRSHHQPSLSETQNQLADLIHVADFMVRERGINEGAFGQGNGSISFLNTDSNTFSEDLYFAANNLPLGDVAQSISLYDNRAFIAVNNSQKMEVVSLENFGQCWTFSGFQFTNDAAIDLLVTGSTFSTCQDCFNFVAPNYFSACCSNYTFTFEDSFQSTFEPKISWYVEIPPSGTGTGTGYTGCTVVISNYETPDQTYVSTTDWNSSTNRNYSIVLPNPIMRNCNDCEEINPC
jgi:hypothetical protein